MNAIVVHKYGGPEVLQFEQFPDPVAGPGQVVLRVIATSVNPIDIMRRTGVTKDFFPIHFPGVIGVDVAGTVDAVGPGVEGVSVGDRVCAYASQTYAERCAVKASDLARVPSEFDLIDAAAVPLVATTGHQVVDDTNVQRGQTVVVTGAAGNVGRSAVFAAKERGATVIAAVRRAQLDAAATLGADQLIATEDDAALASLKPVDAVADTIGGKTAERLAGKVKKGGVFATAVAPPGNAGQYPGVRFIHTESAPSARILEQMLKAVVNKRLAIPIGRKFSLREAAEAHALVQKGGAGKVLLIA